MTNAELTAYNYGKRLAAGATDAVKAGNGRLLPDECVLTVEEQASLEALGRDAWWALVLRGGNEVLGSQDDMRPVQE